MSLKDKKLIFVIEDSPDMRALIREILEGEGYRVEHAKDGEEGLLKLSMLEEKPAVILLDLMMPVMDGFEFRARQELDPKIAEVPIVLMSADSRVDIKRLKIGAKDCLRKPIEIQHLIETVARYT